MDGQAASVGTWRGFRRGGRKASFRATPPVAAIVTAIAAWALVGLLAVGVLGTVNAARLASAFEAEARALHQVVSQRADQHDAHLTALSALLASPDPSFRSTRAVAEAVRRFYPRVAALDVLTLDPSPTLLLTTREQGLGGADVEARAERARSLQTGRTALLSEPSEGRYTLVKRLVVDGEPGAAALEVTAARLAEPETPLPSGTIVSISDPDGRRLYATTDEGASSDLVPELVFERPLGSRSQPLVLRVARRPALAEIAPPIALLMIGLATAAGVAAILAVLSARRGAREAERQALLLRHEARLAHVMRVDAVSEMGSGIAHELTQPLTAILSGSQAGLRLARGGEGLPPEIASVLEANVRQARRAGDILGRLRAYAAGRPPEPRPVDLNVLVREAADLLAHDLDARAVALTLDLDEGARPVALADPVSVEQVVHNLVRNAVDALRAEPADRRAITVATRIEDGEAAVSVADTGPGIPAADLPRLFDPFFTTKADGMGLGLSLCERLAEAFGGRVEAANRPEGGAVFTLRLPLSAVPQAAG